LNFKKSQFLFLIPLTDRYYVLYNTLNSAVALIDEEVKECLEKDTYSKIPSDILKCLEEEEFLIPEDLDEIKYYQFLVNKAIYSTDILSFVILTTYDCNFSCIYCYEKAGGMIAPINMDIETAQKVTAYIKRRIEITNPDILSIALYGGEPLLNIDPGLLILDNMKRFSLQNGIELKCGLITNGSLMTKEKIVKLLECNLTSIQVTIDGTEEVHNNRRPFKDGKGSFSLIMKNVIDAIDIIPSKTIVIRSNIDRMNYNDYPLFLDYLASVGLKNKIKIGIGVPRGVFPYCMRMQFSEKEIADRVFELWKIALKKGFEYHIEPSSTLCSAMQENSLLIDPVGDLYKCWGLVGKKTFVVGSIYEEKYKPIFYEFITRSPLISQKCRLCNILPYCNGACLYEAYWKTGSPFNIICSEVFGKEALEKILKLYVMDRYKSLLKEKGLYEELIDGR